MNHPGARDRTDACVPPPRGSDLVGLGAAQAPVAFGTPKGIATCSHGGEPLPELMMWRWQHQKHLSNSGDSQASPAHITPST